MTNDLKTKIAEMAKRRHDVRRVKIGGWSWEDLPPARKAEAIEKMEAALQAIHDAGYAVVPRDPTEAMIDAHYAAHATCGRAFASAEEVYAAMIQASQPKTEEG